MSTGDVFLSVSSMSSDALAKRMLTPLPEEDDETLESRSQTRQTLVHPEFDMGKYMHSDDGLKLYFETPI